MVHAFVNLTITNPDSLAQYRVKAADALARHNGAVVQASRDLTALEGSAEMPDLAALLSFPDVASAQAWIKDPDLADVHALRRGAGKSDIILLG